MARPRIVLLDVNGTLTEPAAIGAPWGRPDLGARALDGAVRTAMVDALLGLGDRPFADHIRASVAVLAADEELDPRGLDDAVQAAASLPARSDAAAALGQLRDSGVRLVALTNSGAEAGERTLHGAGLIGLIDRVLGVDAVGTFKPDPRVYAHALDVLDARRPSDLMLLATHPWDLAGADHAGISTAWVTHGVRGWPQVFRSPDVRGETLTEAAGAILAY